MRTNGKKEKKVTMTVERGDAIECYWIKHHIKTALAFTFGKGYGCLHCVFLLVSAGGRRKT